MTQQFYYFELEVTMNEIEIDYFPRFLRETQDSKFSIVINSTRSNETGDQETLKNEIPVRMKIEKSWPSISDDREEYRSVAYYVVHKFA